MGFIDYMNNPFDMIGNHNQREVGRDEVDGFIIDTCWTSDEGFETAIEQKNRIWVVVERYKNQEEAVSGHEKWCGFIREGKRKVKSLGWSDMSFMNTEVELK